ncbi:H-NS family nucleoid-associated regulatory protein [Polaromonas sp.]|uniref:H-NS histone family protein n=1 Tax=Polaromonas sp. TaxID=1869339 RepID=UPI00352BAC35
MSKTYAQLAREIAALQASAQKQLAVESKSAVAKINEMIAKFNLTASDLRFALSDSPKEPTSRDSNSKGLSTQRSPQATSTSRRAKYRDDQGNSWGGRGPRPAWLRSAIAAGHAIESFLAGAKSSVLRKPVSLASSAAASSVPARKSAAKPNTPKPVAAPAVALTRALPKIKAAQSAAVSKPAAKSAAVKRTKSPQTAASTATQTVAKVRPKTSASAKRVAPAKTAPKTAVKKAPAVKNAMALPTGKAAAASAAVSQASSPLSPPAAVVAAPVET